MKKLTKLAVKRRLARLDRKNPMNPELTHKVINGYVFEDLDLSGVRFDASELEGCTFRNCALDRASFRDASLPCVRFINCTFDRTSFLGARLHSYSFVSCLFTEAMFVGTQFYAGGFWRCVPDTTIEFRTSIFSELYGFEVGQPKLWDVQGDGRLIHSLTLAGHTVAYTKDSLTVDWEVQPIGNPDEWLQRGPTEPFKNPHVIAWWEEWMPTLRTIVKKAPVTDTKRCEYNEF